MKKFFILFAILLFVVGNGMKAQRIDHYDNEKLIKNSFDISSDKLKSGIYIKEDSIGDIESFYKSLRSKNIPIYISADAMAHVYHILFDYSLAKFEEETIIPTLEKLLKSLIKKFSNEKYSDYSIKGKALLLSYLKVSYTVLTDENISLNVNEKKEVEFINKHEGFAKSVIFQYKEDYSQYVSRGHYTKSEALKRYFKAMMYMGRMTFLAKLKSMDESVLNEQTAAALILTYTIKDNNELGIYWSSIFNPISKLIGFSDDLVLSDYALLFKEIDGLNIHKLKIAQLKKAREIIAEMRPPKIYSGLGDLDVKNSNEANKKLAETIGMRFFGQRFVFDSFIFSKMVFPYIGEFDGKGKPMTGRPKRFFPNPLDILNVFNMDYAKELLDENQGSKYNGYDKQIENLKKYMSTYSEKKWNETVYNKWIKSLVYLYNSKDNIPHKKRIIRTILGSWTELRHDTILYVKQSYTMKVTAFRPRPKPKKNQLMGYPEDNMKFWRSFDELCDMTASFYRNDYQLYDKFQKLGSIAQRMSSILEKKNISEKDMDYFYKFPDTIKSVLSNVDTRSKNSYLVADVHTDANSKSVLEVGVYGFSHMFIVPKDYPNYIFVGPIFNYTHFISKERLTDEKFKVMFLNKTLPQLDYLKQ
ncbi:DUF3160 domain-containing protein [bacterium]|nr:DUF3160 domain-containing protein [bacterium]